MKNLILISALVATVLSACNSNQSNYDNAIYENASLNNEAQKPFMAIKIIKIIDSINSVDAFGDSLRLNQWYLRSNNTKVVFPIKNRTVINRINIGNDEINTMSFPLSTSKHKTEKARIQINNGTVMGMCVDAEVLLLGENKLILNDSYKDQEIFVK